MERISERAAALVEEVAPTRPVLPWVDYQPGDTARDVYVRGLEQAVRDMMDHFGRMVALCESPIEQLMFAGLTSYLRYHPHFRFLAHWDIPAPAVCERVYCIPQAQIGIYRADFLLLDQRVSPPRRTIIECDGHDFHERTKEQAQRDRARDRWFTTNGYTVLRFTGSEIYKDVGVVVDQIAEWLERS